MQKTRKEREVWEVCEHLTEQNVKITYQAIGDTLVKLGFRRGSNSDIRRYLHTWLGYRKEQNVKTEPKPLLSANPFSFSKNPSEQPHSEDSNNLDWQQAQLSIESLQQEYVDHLVDLERQLAFKEEQIQQLQANLKAINEQHQGAGKSAPSSSDNTETGLALAKLHQKLQIEYQKRLMEHFAHHQNQMARLLEANENLRKINHLLQVKTTTCSD